MEIIDEVIFMPKPVIPSTPTMSEAHKIIEAIIATCRPEKRAASLNRDFARCQSNLKSNPIRRSKAALRIAKAAAY